MGVRLFCLRSVGGLIALGLVPLSAQAQVLVAIPNCGMPGDTALITGSGWAEPAPPCDYLFFLDGAQVAPPQPDGLFGPPNANFTVPALPAGDYELKVELRLFDGTLLQCRETTFKVVDMVLDPWMGNVTTPNGTAARIEFDPSGVCDVSPCTKIVMVQTVQQIGEKADMTTRPLTFAEQGFPNSATLDADVTSAGIAIDYVPGENDPYYNGDDPADGVQQGVQGANPVSSIISDQPRRSDANYPSDITKIILQFETVVFCATGSGKGEFSGKVTWRWERTKGAAGTNGTSTILSMNRDAPSAALVSALSLWGTNHSFTLPTMMPPTTGGMACN